MSSGQPPKLGRGIIPGPTAPQRPPVNFAHEKSPVGPTKKTGIIPQRKGSFEDRLSEYIESLKKYENADAFCSSVYNELQMCQTEKKPVSKLVKALMGLKGRNWFEESTSKETTEGILWAVLDSLSQSSSSTNLNVAFKFLLMQNFRIVRTRSLVKKMIDISLARLGKYLNQDRFILAILQKLTFDNQDEIKQYRVEIIR